jgi:hypothetical protein
MPVTTDPQTTNQQITHADGRMVHEVEIKE